MYRIETKMKSGYCWIERDYKVASYKNINSKKSSSE